MTFLGLQMIIFGHFSRFLASFKISFFSLQHPIYKSLFYLLHIRILSVKKRSLKIVRSINPNLFKNRKQRCLRTLSFLAPCLYEIVVFPPPKLPPQYCMTEQQSQGEFISSHTLLSIFPKLPSLPSSMFSRWTVT